MHTDTVIRLRRPAGTAAADPDGDGRDDFGDPVTAFVRVPLRGCVISSGATTDEPDAAERELVTAERTIHPPVGADLLATDLLELPGEVLADGTPARWRVVGQPVHRRPHPFTGTTFRPRVTVRRVEG